jgi:hypothetical protein
MAPVAGLLVDAGGCLRLGAPNGEWHYRQSARNNSRDDTVRRVVPEVGNRLMQHIRGLLMSAHRIGFILAAMLMAISFAGVPASAQQDEAAALDRTLT